MKIQKLLQIQPSETIFLGDDINDLIVLPAVKMFLVPNDAHESCKKYATWIGESNGGDGFVRECADCLLISKKIDPWDPLINKND